MSFAAKFGGTCAKCAGHIPAGASVNYDGKAIRHAPRCPAKGSANEVAAPARQDDVVNPDTMILGKAEYKGKDGYLVLWTGVTKEGKHATKLAFRDGTKTFWGNGDVRITKTYREPISFGRLNEMAKEFRREKAAEQPAQPGDKGFTREGKSSATVGEKFRKTAKDGSVHYYEIVSVGKSSYASQDDLEDMDDFTSRPGWSTPFTAREIAATEEQLAADARKAAEAEEAKTLATAIRASFGSDSHIGYSAPASVTMTDIWSEIRMAGSEHWYVGSDSIVYHMCSDYDMGPSWWRTTATVEQIERAKALGLKVIA